MNQFRRTQERRKNERRRSKVVGEQTIITCTITKVRRPLLKCIGCWYNTESCKVGQLIKYM